MASSETSHVSAEAAWPMLLLLLLLAPPPAVPGAESPAQGRQGRRGAQLVVTG